MGPRITKVDNVEFFAVQLHTDAGVIGVIDGYYQLPTEPGVGLELTDDTLSKYMLAKTTTS